jgi:hypothetical protein
MIYGIVLLANSKKNIPFLMSNSCVSTSYRQLPFRTSLQIVYHAWIINATLSACLKRFAAAHTHQHIVRNDCLLPAARYNYPLLRVCQQHNSIYHILRLLCISPYIVKLNSVVDWNFVFNFLLLLCVLCLDMTINGDQTRWIKYRTVV